VLPESDDLRTHLHQRNSSEPAVLPQSSASWVGSPISHSLTPLFVRNPSELFLYLLRSEHEPDEDEFHALRWLFLPRPVGNLYAPISNFGAS